MKAYYYTSNTGGNVKIVAVSREMADLILGACYDATQWHFRESTDKYL